MSTVIIVGSRREGNSYNFAKKLKEEIKNERIDAPIITPGNQKIYVCTGCMDCDKNGVCDFTDDMKDNIEKIRNVDTLIIITPTRWNLLSGDLKIFMDRLNPMYSKRELKGKNLIAISIGAKGKEVYSTSGAITTLGLFAESSGMNLIYKHEFNDCLDTEDILNSNDLDKVISDIKNLIK